MTCNVAVVYQKDRDGLACFGRELEKGLDLSKLYQKQWQALSNGAQAGFFCPAPKSALDNATMASASENNVDYESKISPYFALLVFCPVSVDYLNLKTSPHTREIHTDELGKWHISQVNP